MRSLCDLYKLPDEEFIEEIKRRYAVELGYFKGKTAQSLSVPRATGSRVEVLHSFKEPQAMRAVSALLLLKDIYNGKDIANGDEKSYECFVACQRKSKEGIPVLTKKSFGDMYQFVFSEIKTEQDLEALTWSALCSNLIQVEDLKKQYSGPLLSPPAMLSELLKTKPDLFPAFKKLTDDLKQALIAGYASGGIVSQIEEQELPKVSIKMLAQLTKMARHLEEVKTLLVIAASSADKKIEVVDKETKETKEELVSGSITMHEDTWRHCSCLFERIDFYLSKNIDADYANKISDDYLTYRGRYRRNEEEKSGVGIENNSRENSVLLRIACQARISTKGEADILMKAWASLPSEIRNNLIEELSITGLDAKGDGKRPIHVAFTVPILENSIKAYDKIKKESKSVALEKGIVAGLIQIDKIFRATRSFINNHQDKQKINSVELPYVAFCPSIASAMATDPTQSFEFIVTGNPILDKNGIPRRSALTSNVIPKLASTEGNQAAFFGNTPPSSENSGKEAKATPDAATGTKQQLGR